jgi:tetratricopeptide (TPR) repeat protein
VTAPASASASTSRPAPDALVRSGMRARARADFARAEILFTAAIREAEEAQPADRATLAGALNAMGLLCKDLARYDHGRACYDRALALVSDAPAAYAHEIATLYHNLAGLAHARRDFAEAEPLARRGLAVREHAEEPNPPAMAADMIALAAILDGLLRYDEAERLYLDALAILEAPGRATTEEERGDVAAALNNLGAQLVCRGRVDEATAPLERALTLKRALLGDGHPDVAVSLHNLALAWKRSGDRTRAVALLEEAVAMFTTTLGDAHPRTARSRAQLERLRV